MSGSHSRPVHPPSEAVEDYAKAIYSLQRRSAGPVTTNALAERLGVAPASVSGMVRKLADLGLARHEPYHGVSLTERGRRLALEVLRHHRLLELYLTRELEMPWERVHAEAERLEHVLSEELEELIASKLGDPKIDPHGDPIPSRDGSVEELRTRSLADLGPGERGRFLRVSDADPELLRHLTRRSLAPGCTLEVTGLDARRKRMSIRVEGREQSIGLKAARAVRVSA